MISLRVKIRQLHPEDEYYVSKIDLLTKLLHDPEIGYIIPPEIVDWCNEQGFITEHHAEDRTSWWTCRAK